MTRVVLDVVAAVLLSVGVWRVREVQNHVVAWSRLGLFGRVLGSTGSIPETSQRTGDRAGGVGT